MGKRSRDAREDEEAVKSPFGTDNPFRRKPEPDADGGDVTQPTKKLRLGMDSSAAEKETITEAKIVELSNARKRKRDWGIIAAAPSAPSSNEKPIPRKRKKLVDEVEVDGLKKKKNKRKRDEVGLEYEKRNFGSVGEKEPSARDAREDEEAVKSPFGTDNPFRRKPEPDADGGDGTQPTKKLRLGMDSSAAEKETITEAKLVELSDARKRKRDWGRIAVAPSAPSSNEEPIPKKRKKLVDEVEVDGLKKKKKKNKRKRDEVGLEYEKRNFGSVGEKEPSATGIAVGEKRKADSAAEDMLTNTKESIDDHSKLLRTVFVGNLPLKMKGKALNREFSRFGEIEAVRIRYVPLVDTKAPRKAAVIEGQVNEEVDGMNAYIVFKEENSAYAALSKNMTKIGGNHICVDLACPSRKKMKGLAQQCDKKKAIFVENLPFDVQDEELYQLFCGICKSKPNVKAVLVVRDFNTSMGKGIAYVIFKTREAANDACKRRDWKIRDRNLRVSHA